MLATKDRDGYSRINNVINIIKDGIPPLMTSRTVEIKIQERKLKVACPLGDETALLTSAKLLTDRLDLFAEKTSISNPEQALLMTALNLAHDLLNAEKQLDTVKKENQQKIDLLQATIEQAIAPTLRKPA
ncbi:MAG: cell division protein ZapA [Colwellia sp.]